MSTTAPKGFLLVPDWLSTVDETVFADCADSILNRRAKATAYFGYGYFPHERWLDNIPEWLLPENLLGDSYPGRDDVTAFNAVQVRRYGIGEESTSHFDRFEFGNEIAVLSFGGSGVIQFKRPSTGFTLDIDIPARSLYVMRDDARYLFQHAVLPAKQTRYSIVIRTACDDRGVPLPRK